MFTATTLIAILFVTVTVAIDIFNPTVNVGQKTIRTLILERMRYRIGQVKYFVRVNQFSILKLGLIVFIIIITTKT